MQYALWVFLMIFPFALFGYLGLVSIPFSLGIGYIYVMLEYVGKHIEHPFENLVNDTPLNALSITIETNLRQDLGEEDLPEPEELIDGILY
ncbi:hypothetical protein E1171_02545 [Cytophagales bacterium RKSG123]|nr:hypothetical protein [Xanthovirga aplysinae]